jgi:mannose-1-phosphate guanylyltransferase
MAGAQVGAHCALSGCVVAAGVRIGNHCTVSDGVVLGEGVTVGADNVLARGARVFPNVEIPDGAIRF